MNQERKKASYLIELLCTWHNKIGRLHCGHLQLEDKHTYLTIIESLAELNVNSPEIIRKVANLQIQGVFEYFYGEVIPDDLWADLVPAAFELTKPENLGEAARLALKLLKEEDNATESKEALKLPPNWETKPSHLQTATIEFPVYPREERVQKLRLLFGDLVKLQNLGIGGCELMVSMNEDWQDSQRQNQAHTLVYSPACFGFQLATGDGNLVTQIINGEIAIVDVTIGVEQSQVQLPEEEL